MLTDDRLVFLMWMPRRELIIPLDSVEAVDTTRSHLGKTMSRDLLPVCWRDPRGGQDATAWLLDDLAAGTPPSATTHRADVSRNGPTPRPAHLSDVIGARLDLGQTWQIGWHPRSPGAALNASGGGNSFALEIRLY